MPSSARGLSHRPTYCVVFSPWAPCTCHLPFKSHPAVTVLSSSHMGKARLRDFTYVNPHASYLASSFLPFSPQLVTSLRRQSLTAHPCRRFAPALFSAIMLKLFFLEFHTFVITHLFVYMFIICFPLGAEPGFIEP